MADYLGSYNTSSTVRFMFTTHDTDGAAVAPSSAFEAADIRVYKDGSATQRASEAGYTMTSPFDSVTGLHAVAIDLSDNTDAGFYAAGSEYAVVLVPDETVDALAVVRVLAYFSIERVVKVNVTQWLGQAVAAVTTNGVPEVDVTHIAGSAVSTSSAQLGVNVVNAAGTAWGSGAITAASIAADAITAAKIADGAIDAGAIASDAFTAAKFAADCITAAKIANGAIDADTFAAGAINAAAIAAGAIDADALAADAATEIRSLASGTSDSGSTTTMVDAARTEADTDYWKGMLIVFTSGTIAGQARVITAFDAATDTITFSPATTQAVSTQTYEIWPAGDFLRPTTSGRTLDVSAGGESGVDWANVGGQGTSVSLTGTTVATTTTATNVTTVNGLAANVITAASIAADAITAAKIANGAIDADTFAAGAINAAAIATGAIDADALAADAIDEIWDEAMTELSAVPGVTASLRDAIRWLFLLSRNKITQTATTQLLRNDADAATVGTSTLSDDGTTFIRGEFS